MRQSSDTVNTTLNTPGLKYMDPPLVVKESNALSVVKLRFGEQLPENMADMIRIVVSQRKGSEICMVISGGAVTCMAITCELQERAPELS